MNAERLHAIVTALRQELAQRNMVSNLTTLVSALRNMSSQPANPSYQQTLVGSRETLRNALSDAPSDAFSPTWRQVLGDIGGGSFFGRNLLDTIEETINENQMTPTVALQRLESIQSGLQTFSKALDSAATAFSAFEIGSEELAPGECEIGILIPRQAVNNKLREYVEELGEIEFILRTLTELATGGVEDLEIRTVSSSDLMLFLSAHPRLGAVMARVIDFIVTQYKKILDIKKVQREIERLELPEDISEKTKNHANNLMEAEIDKFTIEIMTEYESVSDDGHRRNELKNAVTICLNTIANRIDRGFNFEVRVEPPAPTDANADIQNAVQTIRAASVSMQFMKVEGPPILALTEKTETAAEEDRKEKKRTKPRKGEPKE
ncbi:MAG: hypothetical protein ACLPXM_15670 [Terriglobales bacterium]